MKSCASQPLGLSVFKERRAGDHRLGTPDQAFANQLFSCPRLLCSQKMLHSLANAGWGMTFIRLGNVWKIASQLYEDLFTAASALQRGTVEEEPTSRLSWGICFQLGVCVCLCE